MSDFLAYFVTNLPTPVRFCLIVNFQFYYMVSNFGKSTYIQKNRTPFVNHKVFTYVLGQYLVCPKILINSFLNNWQQNNTTKLIARRLSIPDTALKMINHKTNMTQNSWEELKSLSENLDINPGLYFLWS